MTPMMRKDGWTILHYAAGEGNLPLARYFVLMSKTVEVPDQEGVMPIHVAAYYGKLEVLRFLLDKIQNPDAQQDRNGLTPLHYAVLGEQPEAARELLARGCHPNARDKNGITPLHLAVLRERPDLVTLLLDHGAEVNASDRDGETPLHIAAYLGAVETARVLLDRGADPKAGDRHGFTPLHAACATGFSRMKDFLVQEKGYPEDAPPPKEFQRITSLTRKSHVEVARLLHEHGADINARDQRQDTPLHVAAVTGNRELVDLLLQWGADPFARNAYGDTPLDLARQAGYEDIVDLLTRARSGGTRG